MCGIRYNLRMVGTARRAVRREVAGSNSSQDRNGISVNMRQKQFSANAQRLIDALEDPVPPWSDSLQKQADHALQGAICEAEDGSYAQVGFENVDWTCAKTYNPERVQMYLLRFHVLVPLAAVFRESKDERYARAARRFIEAFLRDHPIHDDWRPARYDGPTQYDLRVGCCENAGWLGTLHVFLGSEAFDEPFFETM